MTLIGAKTTEIAKFKQLIDDYFAAWSFAISGNGIEALDRPAPFYAKDKNLVFYDPMQPLEGHHDWQKFKFDVVKVWSEAGILNADIRRTEEPLIWRYSNLALAIVPNEVTLTLQNGESKTVQQRLTMVWQQQNNQWLIIHEHASAAVSLGSNLASRSGLTPVKDDAAEFRQLISDFWKAWNIKDSAVASSFYAQTPDLVVYLPWKTEGFFGWDAFKKFADNVMQNMQTVQFVPDENIHVLQLGEIAVCAGIFSVKMQDKNNTTTQGDARYTLIWKKHDDRWLIVHEHLSSTVG